MNDSANAFQAPRQHGGQGHPAPSAAAPAVTEPGGHGPPETDRLTWRPFGGGGAVVGRARDWLRRALPRLVGRTAREHLFDDTELLLCELVTNAVQHAGGVTAVELRTVGGVLRVTVWDDSAGLPVARAAASDAECGRGLGLVKVLATRWGVEREPSRPGKRVWLELPTTAATVVP